MSFDDIRKSPFTDNHRSRNGHLSSADEVVLMKLDLSCRKDIAKLIHNCLYMLNQKRVTRPGRMKENNHLLSQSRRNIEVLKGDESDYMAKA